MQLLMPIPASELPREALLARLRSRRARLGQLFASAPEADLQAALEWVYVRLDARALRQLRPYLEVLALRSLLLGLRYRLAGEPLPSALARLRLLNPALFELLDRPGEPATVVLALEQALCADYPFAAGLAGCYLNQGPGGVEQQLGSGILSAGLARSRTRVVRQVLTALIDLRNLLAVLKYWRWQVATPPPLLAGGALPTPQLRRLWAAQDQSAMLKLLRRLSVLPPADSEPRSVERLLLGSLSRRLQRSARDPLGLGVIVDYLWRCQIEAGNRNLRQLLGEGREELLAEALLL